MKQSPKLYICIDTNKTAEICKMLRYMTSLKKLFYVGRG